MQSNFTTRKIAFKIFNRKEIQKNKPLDLEQKYGCMDSYDNDMEFWKLMRSTVQTSRGHFSRNIPKTPQLWAIQENEEKDMAKYGNLQRRKIADIVAEVKKNTNGISSNGSINLKKIDWSPKLAMDAELKRLREEQKQLMLEHEAELVAQQGKNDNSNSPLPIESKYGYSGGYRPNDLIVKK